MHRSMYPVSTWARSLLYEQNLAQRLKKGDMSLWDENNFKKITPTCALISAGLRKYRKSSKRSGHDLHRDQIFRHWRQRPSFLRKKTTFFTSFLKRLCIRLRALVELTNVSHWSRKLDNFLDVRNLTALDYTVGILNDSQRFTLIIWYFPYWGSKRTSTTTSTSIFCSAAD